MSWLVFIPVLLDNVVIIVIKILAPFIRDLVLPYGWKSRIVCLLQPKFIIGTLAVVFNKKNEVLLFRHTYRLKEWGLPGGFVKSHEDPIKSIKREIYEESTLRIFNLKLFSIIRDDELTRLTVIYIANGIKGVFKSSSEVSEVKYYQVDKLPKLPHKQARIIKEALRFCSRN